MASSISIYCQQNSNFLDRNHSFAPSDHHNNARVGPCSVSISRDIDVSKWKRWTIRSVDSVNSHHSGIAIAKRPTKRFFDDGDGDDKKAATVVYEKLDKWMQNSVVEIVKNLKEAPLLVHVYDKGSETTTLKTEKSVEEENWNWVTNKWGRKETPVPEGVIFVEQLMDRDEKQEREAEEITRAWGVVVQGKGVECAPVCYLLKTSRVAAAGSGLLGGGGGGVCCTHYCLMRVQNFRESALSQLKNCWLVRG